MCIRDSTVATPPNTRTITRAVMTLRAAIRVTEAVNASSTDRLNRSPEMCIRDRLEILRWAKLRSWSVIDRARRDEDIPPVVAEPSLA